MTLKADLAHTDRIIRRYLTCVCDFRIGAVLMIHRKIELSVCQRIAASASRARDQLHPVTRSQSCCHTMHVHGSNICTSYDAETIKPIDCQTRAIQMVN